jgi:CRISPR-associated protein Cmr2
MGRVIAAREQRENHWELSQKLAEFSRDAGKIVETNHGCLVYSGGDDVLAFLPVDTCLMAARELHDRFCDLLKDFPDMDGNPPTISMGIAIGHSSEPLEDLLEYARNAEAEAKNPDRDGLAVHYHTRSGGDPIRVREQWKPKGMKGLDEHLAEFAGMHRDEKIPDKAAYDMQELAEVYKDNEWNKIAKNEEFGELIFADARRLLKRKGMNGDSEALITDLLSGIDSYDAIRGLADQLILARKLTGAIKQAKGRSQTGGSDS